MPNQKHLKKILHEQIQKTFVKAREISKIKYHPRKKNVKAKRIFRFQPDFSILHMQLASIKPDQKYKRKAPDNKCLITSHLTYG